MSSCNEISSDIKKRVKTLPNIELFHSMFYPKTSKSLKESRAGGWMEQKESGDLLAA